MSTMTKRIGAFAALVIVSIAGSTIPTEGAVQNCKVNDARAALSNGSVSDLCGCQTVTRGMVQYIQNRSDFASVLRETETSCRSLSKILSEVPTANIERQRYGRNGEEPSGSAESAGFAPNNFGGSNAPSGADDQSGPGDSAAVNDPGGVSDPGGGNDPGGVSDPDGGNDPGGVSDPGGGEDPVDLSDSGGGDDPETPSLGWNYPGITFH